MSGYQVSLIIPLTRFGRCQGLIDAIQAQIIPPLEIIFACAANPKMKVNSVLPIQWCITGRLLSPGAMRNRGAQIARGDLFFFLDDDCLPGPEWIEKTIDVLIATPQIGAVACRVVSPRRSFWQGCADYVLFSASQHRRSMSCCVGSAALAVKREAFVAAGGFDTELLASEDWDFSLRMMKSGWIAWFDANVSVSHDHDRTTMKEIIKQAYLSGYRSGLTVQRKHEALVWRGWRFIIHHSHPSMYVFWGAGLAVIMWVRGIWELRGVDPRWPFYLPILLFARVSYQYGVWKRLLHERRSNRRGIPTGLHEESR
jgi:cellulose synthase/poly-beta-1,6-N-acetylglucosamine synthase-like glycosyltransferase